MLIQEWILASRNTSCCSVNDGHALQRERICSFCVTVQRVSSSWSPWWWHHLKDLNQQWQQSHTWRLVVATSGRHELIHVIKFYELFVFSMSELLWPASVLFPPVLPPFLPSYFCPLRLPLCITHCNERAGCSGRRGVTEARHSSAELRAAIVRLLPHQRARVCLWGASEDQRRAEGNDQQESERREKRRLARVGAQSEWVLCSFTGKLKLAFFSEHF